MNGKLNQSIMDVSNHSKGLMGNKKWDFDIWTYMEGFQGNRVPIGFTWEFRHFGLH